jgi:hypothetical protein
MMHTLYLAKLSSLLMFAIILVVQVRADECGNFVEGEPAYVEDQMRSRRLIGDATLVDGPGDSFDWILYNKEGDFSGGLDGGSLLRLSARKADSSKIYFYLIKTTGSWYIKIIRGGRSCVSYETITQPTVVLGVKIFD